MFLNMLWFFAGNFSIFGFRKNKLMVQQIIFIAVTIIAFGMLAWSFSTVFRIIRILKSPYSIFPLGPRIKRFFTNGIFQERILRFPFAGILHALVFWGFLMILFGSFEMLLDGLLGTDRIFTFLVPVYNFFMASGDIFGLIIAIAIIIFLIRRFLNLVKRFRGIEMTHKSHLDANFALLLILILMISLLLMNASFVAMGGTEGYFPVGRFLAKMFFASTSPATLNTIYHINWWVHILTIFVFMNYLPYSKHFHVFMSLPNVFFSRMTPLTKMYNMERVTKEVKLMLSGNAFDQPAEENPEEIERFGMKDVQDGTWKNYIDSLTCTQCGRCTSVCPANLTGKLLSPRKIVMNYRTRMTEIKGKLLKEGKTFQDNHSLLGDYISKEELWACTTCNACAQECPLNIDHPSIILEMRRYLVMEESSAPTPINTMFNNTENNGAPWQYPPHERIKWAEELYINEAADKRKIEVPVMADITAQGKKPDILFWVGSAESFDDRAKKITRSFVKILEYSGINYAVLGNEEIDTGDSARRAGNEFLFQMQAIQVIETLNNYQIKKIVTCDPHDYNILKNEYPELGGNYEVLHHSEFIKELIDAKKITLNKKTFGKIKMTYHDPCYLGRGNGVYEAPRFVIRQLSDNLTEMHRNKSKALCCGGGGAQMFKEAEKGNKEVYELRTEDALTVNPEVIITACPLCMTMFMDGIKMKEKEKQVRILDIAEIITESLFL